MKITLVGTAYPLRGGLAHMNATLFRKLTAAGHDVHLINFSRQYPSLLFPGKTQLESGTDEPNELRVPNERLLDSIHPLSWWRVGEKLRRERPDVVVIKYWLPFFGPAFGTLARRARANGHTRIVYLLDNVIPHEARPGDRAFTRYALAPGDGFIAMSESVAADLRQFRSDAPLELVPHPVYDIFGLPPTRAEARATLGLGETDEVALFFGYIRPYKGLDGLLDAMPALVARRPNAKLLAVGEVYGDESAVRAKADALPVPPGTVRLLTDYVPNEQVATYFAAADVIVLPYRSATQSGIVQIAYHFDRPAIVTAVGGLAEVVRDGETGFVVPPDDPAALTDALDRFFADRRGADMSAAVAVEKQRYSWDRMVEAIERLAAPVPTASS